MDLRGPDISFHVKFPELIPHRLRVEAPSEAGACRAR